MHIAESIETRRQDMQPEERIGSPEKRVNLWRKFFTWNVSGCLQLTADEDTTHTFSEAGMDHTTSEVASPVSSLGQHG